jgi:hypothetical protein
MKNVIFLVNTIGRRKVAVVVGEVWVTSVRGRSMRILGNSLCFQLIIFALIAPAAVAQTTYKITDLGNGGLTSADGLAINDLGTVAGQQMQVIPFDASGEEIDLHPFIAIAGESPMQLGPVNGNPVGINNSNKIAINDFTQVFSFAPSEGFFGLGTPSGNLPFSLATGINNAGQIVGNLSKDLIGRPPQVPFIYTLATGMQPLNFAPGQSSISNVQGINNNGQIIGIDSNNNPAIYSLSTGTVQDIGTLNIGEGLFPTAINDLGQVVGFFGEQASPGVTVGRGFIYTPGLGMSQFALPSPTEINNLGDVVERGIPEMFFPSAGIINVNSLLPASSGWKLMSADAINNLGQITGEGIDPSGQDVAYVLTPIPEPAMGALVGFGAVLALSRRR